MSRVTLKSRALLLVLLPLVIIAAVFWQTRPSPSQERQDHLNSALMVTSNPNAIRDLIHSGADPNFCQQPSPLEKLQADHPLLCYLSHSSGTPIYETALAQAIGGGDVYAVKALLDGGASPQQKDSLGQTALEHAREVIHGIHFTRKVTPRTPDNYDKILLMMENAEAERVAGSKPTNAHKAN